MGWPRLRARGCVFGDFQDSPKTVGFIDMDYGYGFLEYRVQCSHALLTHLVGRAWVLFLSFKVTITRISKFRIIAVVAIEPSILTIRPQTSDCVPQLQR